MEFGEIQELFLMPYITVILCLQHKEAALLAHRSSDQLLFGHDKFLYSQQCGLTTLSC